MKNRTGYDLNTLVIIGNFCVCAIAIILYYIKGHNQYINIYSLLLLCILGCENILFLLYDKKQRDPFVFILVLNTVIFFMGRVVSLIFSTYSSVLIRYPYTSDHLNFTLQFIILANASMFLGCYACKHGTKFACREVPEAQQIANPYKITILFVVLFLINHLEIFKVQLFGKLTGYIHFYLVNMMYILLLLVVYLVVNHGKFNKYYIYFMTLLLLTYTIFLTITGSRSAILWVLTIVMCVLLSVKGAVILNKKTIAIGVVLFLLSNVLFIVATVVREMPKPAGYYRYPFLSIVRMKYILHYVPTGRHRLTQDICRIADRTGFLDTCVFR